MPEVILSAGGQRTWPKIRSNSPANQLFFSQRLPRKSMADKGLRCRNRQDSDILDQQFFTNSKYNRGFVSLSLAAVAIFQMDQTTPPNKAIFWDFRKYRKDSIMDRSAVHVQVAIIKFRQKLRANRSIILQILSVTVFENTNLTPVLSGNEASFSEVDLSDQLILFEYTLGFYNQSVGYQNCKVYWVQTGQSSLGGRGRY
jgi:hypothetical protein